MPDDDDRVLFYGRLTGTPYTPRILREEGRMMIWVTIIILLVTWGR